MRFIYKILVVFYLMLVNELEIRKLTILNYEEETW